MKVLSHVDGGFAGALDIEDGGILMGVALRKVALCVGVFFANAPDSALDALSFVEQHIVSHTLSLSG